MSLSPIFQLYCDWWRKPEYPENHRPVANHWQTLSHNVFKFKWFITLKAIKARYEYKIGQYMLNLSFLSSLTLWFPFIRVTRQRLLVATLRGCHFTWCFTCGSPWCLLGTMISSTPKIKLISVIYFEILVNTALFNPK